MTYPDTPDGQRGEVSPQQLLAVVGGGDATVTVAVPANAEAIWILVGPGPDPLPVVQGVGTEVDYPVYSVGPIQLISTTGFAIVALVTSQVDEQVKITWATAPAGTWFVVADTGGRFVVDLALSGAVQTPGQSSPAIGLQVAGTDGTDLRVLLTDSSGRLEVAGSTFPPVYGAPGAAVPADALQVGGTDGTDLRALLTDNLGRLQVADTQIEQALGLPGHALPTLGVLIGGSDGTDLRLIATDASGHLLSIDQTLKLAIAALGAATPADALLVAGSDGTDLRALLTDASGHQLIIDPNLAAAIAAPGAVPPASVVLLGGTDGGHVRAVFLDSSGRVHTIDANLNNAIGSPTTPVPISAVMTAFTDGVDLRVPITSKSALPYMIPSAPSELTADRPPNELTFTSVAGITATQAIVPAPGAGKRLRIFYVQAWAENPAALYYTVGNDVSNLAVFLCRAQTPTGSTPPPANLPLTGLPLFTNAGYFIVVSAGQAGATVGYTIETV